MSNNRAHHTSVCSTTSTYSPSDSDGKDPSSRLAEDDGLMDAPALHRWPNGVACFGYAQGKPTGANAGYGFVSCDTLRKPTPLTWRVGRSGVGMSRVGGV